MKIIGIDFFSWLNILACNLEFLAVNLNCIAILLTTMVDERPTSIQASLIFESDRIILVTKILNPIDTKFEFINIMWSYHIFTFINNISLFKQFGSYITISIAIFLDLCTFGKTHRTNIIYLSFAASIYSLSMLRTVDACWQWFMPFLHIKWTRYNIDNMINSKKI